MTCSKEEKQGGESSQGPSCFCWYFFFQKFLQFKIFKLPRGHILVACSEPLQGLRAGTRRNAPPRKIQQAGGPVPSV